MKKTLSLTLIVVLSTVTGTAKADFTFGEPVNMGSAVNTSAHEFTPCMPADGLSLYFSSGRGGGSGGNDLWVMTRPTISDPWGTPVNLGPAVNSSADDYSLSISADDRTLYFVSNRGGGSGGYDIWATTRPTTTDPWGTPANLGPTVNSSGNEYAVGISADGRMLYFTSNRGGGSGGYDVWVTTRPTTSGPWGTPMNLGPTVNSPSNEWTLGLAADDLRLYVVSDRPGGYGSLDIWVTQRTTANDPWGAPANLGSVINSSSVDGFPSPSADGRMLYFSSNRAGGVGNVDLWQAPVTPIVDFNGDGIVDSSDVSIMVDYWGTDESFCDIGPTPWGDGIVDVQDLIALSEHIGEEVDDPTLLAHWTFDEVEGTVAYDSAGIHDGTVVGAPHWRPSGGPVDGALDLDGATLVVTDAVINPSDNPFSVFCWVNGGAPGQVILSQGDGVNWLQADSVGGKLISSLTPPLSRFDPPLLVSDALIIDGLWHWVGFVWDGTSRRLYVDNALVAEDQQTTLAPCTGGLNIGCGANLEPDSFYSGLIDDVRIYNRAVRP